jgi:hypothetical protein
MSEDMLLKWFCDRRPSVTEAKLFTDVIGIAFLVTLLVLYEVAAPLFGEHGFECLAVSVQKCGDSITRNVHRNTESAQVTRRITPGGHV